MRQLLKYYYFVAFLLVTPLYGQDHLKVSLLSCSPGEDLYSIFGHSAIRVKDGSTGRDMVFNYGTFNFREKNFYLKFMRGKLNYILSVNSYDEFIESYILERRTVYEQVFYLDSIQKSHLIRSLMANAQPAYRAYKYDFFWDNCSTRIRDKIQESYDETILYPPIPPATFRDYLHQYLLQSPWSRFGIDLILGLPADRVMSAEQSMFLPLEMMKIYDHTQVGNKPLNSKSYLIHTPDKSLAVSRSDWTTPTLISFFVLIWSVLCYLFLRDSLWFKLSASVLFTLCATAGLVISFLWFFSDHIATKSNMHLIWANPLLFSYPWLNNPGRPAWVKSFYKTFTFILVGLIVFFFVLPQAMPVPCILIWLSLIVYLIPQFNDK